MKQQRPDSTSPHERGQALILFVFLLAALLGFIALTIDVGQAVVDKRSTQNAVDAAALAGAAYLPNHDAATAKVNQWLTLNGFPPGSGNTVTITTPYNGDPNKIEVRLSNSVGPAFAGAVGFDGFNINSRSVGKRTANPYAIFQTGPNPKNPHEDDHECNGAVEIEATSLTINGAVHADGEMELEGGSGNINGAVTYVCLYKKTGGTITISNGPTKLPAPVPPPVSFQYSDFGPCTFNITGNLTISSSTPQYFVNNNVNTKQLKPGVYCATGSIKLASTLPTGISGNVTFVAHSEVEIENNSATFTPYWQKGTTGQMVLAYSDGCDEGGDAGEGEVEIEGNNVTFSGMLIAPCGEIELEGNNVTSPGTLLLGSHVEVEGSTINITAANYTLGGPHLAE